MPTALKIALIEAGIPQYEIARRSKIINETRLSRLATGRSKPTVAEKKALAKVLRVSIAALFGVEAP